jgi:hypothetical protein
VTVSPLSRRPESNGAAARPELPVEVEIYVNPDGSVTFADLAGVMIPVAAKLNPDWAAECSGNAGEQPLDSEETSARETSD